MTVPRRRLVVPALLVALSHRPVRAGHNEDCFAAADAAQALRDQGKYTQARDRFAACSASVCPEIVQHDCSRWLDELIQAWPTIVVSAEDPSGADIADVRLFVDGEPVAQRLDGNPVRVEPGERAMRFETDGARPVEQKIVVRVGEKNRLVHVRFTRGATRSNASARTTLGWGLGGVSVVALATASYFGLSGLSRYDQLKSGCAKTLPGDCAQADVDFVNRRLLVSDIALGIGAISAAAAVYFLVVSPSKRLQPTFAVGSAGASAGVQGSF